MEVMFREATAADVPGVVALTNRCFEVEDSVEYAQKIWGETENDPNQIYLIGELEGEIVAHLKIAIVPTIFEDMNTFAIINHVCVKPEARRQGLGMKLMAEAERICKERGCKQLKLWSKNFRQPAHAMYQKFGFEILDAKFFEKTIDGVK